MKRLLKRSQNTLFSSMATTCHNTAIQQPIQQSAHQDYCSSTGLLAQVEMFVANLRPEWVDQSTFRAAMDAEGDVIRCFVMCNPQGTAKVCLEA